ncbi:MAG: hypothetical protein Q7R95_02245 [bacterium]|nr:hypothetical protein [bacterium]
MKINNIEQIWTITCLNSSVDQTTNLISMFNIFDELKVDVNLEKEVDVVNVPIQFELITLWKKLSSNLEENDEIQINLTDPVGKKISTFNYKLNIPKDKKRMRYRLVISGLSVTKNGTYVFSIHVKDIKTKEYKEVGNTTIDLFINRKIIKK